MDESLNQIAAAVAERIPYQRNIPQYPDIVRGAKLLKRHARGMRIVAIFFVVLSILSAVVIVGVKVVMLRATIPIQNPEWPQVVLVAVGLALPQIFIATVAWGYAIRLDLQAGLALAQRDVAMNSFRR